MCQTSAQVDHRHKEGASDSIVAIYQRVGIKEQEYLLFSLLLLTGDILRILRAGSVKGY
jgi:hypothetical protein